MHTTLVDPATLERHLGDPRWIVLDVRHELTQPSWGEEEYREEHIPGARFLHLDRDLSAPKTGRNGRHPLPSPSAAAATFGAAGIDATKQVVVYDQGPGAYAARCWWMLRWLGHDAVALLDGGINAWEAAGYETTDAESKHPHAVFVPRLRPDMAVDVGFVESQSAQDGVRLLDARNPQRFRGENETLDPVGGHMPGAVNRFFKDNLLPDGRFKPAEALRAEYQALLAGWRAEEVVHSCGSGVTACHNQLAMEVAGLVGSRLYPGSWSEWCADPARPVATGP